MNQNQLNYEKKVSIKVLNFIDKQLEELTSNERLTGAGNANAAVSQNLETILELSKERRAIIRLLNQNNKEEIEE